MKVRGTRKVSLAEEGLQKGEEFFVPGEGATYKVWGADYTPNMEYGFVLTRDDKGEYGTLQIQRGKAKRGLPGTMIENVYIHREKRMI